MVFLHFPEKIYKAILEDDSIQNKRRAFLVRNTAFNFAVLMAICLLIAALAGALEPWRMLGVAVLCLGGSVFDSARQYQVLRGWDDKR